MRLLSLSKHLFHFVFITILLTSLKAEDSVDIWKKELKKNENQNVPTQEESQQKIELKNKTKDQEIVSTNIKISDNINVESSDRTVHGILDPQENNFNLAMWSNTKGEDIESTLRRINKIKLSKSAEDIFINTIMTYSYLPKDMSEENFLNLKINWLIENNKSDLLEKFLNKNENFKGKKKIIQYLVDKNIAKADLKKGCEKSGFISKEIKDSYLEKFKIYCLIFNDKKNEAQLVFDLLREQGLSDKFFDN